MPENFVQQLENIFRDEDASRRADVERSNSIQNQQQLQIADRQAARRFQQARGAGTIPETAPAPAGAPSSAPFNQPVPRGGTPIGGPALGVLGMIPQLTQGIRDLYVGFTNPQQRGQESRQWLEAQGFDTSGENPFTAQYQMQSPQGGLPPGYDPSNFYPQTPQGGPRSEFGSRDTPTSPTSPTTPTSPYGPPQGSPPSSPTTPSSPFYSGPRTTPRTPITPQFGPPQTDIRNDGPFGGPPSGPFTGPGPGPLGGPYSGSPPGGPFSGPGPSPSPPGGPSFGPAPTGPRGSPPPFFGGQNPAVEYIVEVEFTYTYLKQDGSVDGTFSSVAGFRVRGPVKGKFQLNDTNNYVAYYLEHGNPTKRDMIASKAGNSTLLSVGALNIRRADGLQDNDGNPPPTEDSPPLPPLAPVTFPPPSPPPATAPPASPPASGPGPGPGPDTRTAPPSTFTGPGPNPPTAPSPFGNNPPAPSPPAPSPPASPFTFPPFPFGFPPIAFRPAGSPPGGPPPMVGNPPTVTTYQDPSIANPSPSPSPAPSPPGVGSGGESPPTTCRYFPALDEQIMANTTTTNATLANTNTILGIVSQVQLAGIDQKLGPQMPGGLSGFLSKIWNSNILQKTLSILTFVTVLHNAHMLSSSIVETLFGAFDNVLAIFHTELKDEKGETTDTSQWVGEQVKNFFEGIFGEVAVETTITTWKKYNRIYQAATNIVWTIRSINNSIQEILEWTAENTGKIGNALKKWRLVGENAYKWMPEKVSSQDAYRRKFQRIFNGLEQADDTASSLAAVTGEVRGTVDEVGELTEQTTAFNQALTDAQPKERPDNTPVKQQVEQQKAASPAQNVNPSDLVQGSNGPS